ncbi:hypothetical protein ACFL4W_03040 [Planctomycetota bacterium]
MTNRPQEKKKALWAGIFIFSILSLAGSAYYSMHRELHFEGKMKSVRRPGKYILADDRGEVQYVELAYVNWLELPDKVFINAMEDLTAKLPQQMPVVFTELDARKRVKGRWIKGYLYAQTDPKNPFASVNVLVIMLGYAKYDTSQGISKKHDQDFREAENYAIDHELGIWATP